MQVENHKEEVPFEFYREKFAAIEPEAAAARLRIPFENGAFAVRLLGTTYRIAHPSGEVTADAGGIAGIPVRTFLLRLILEGKPAVPSNDFKTFRELPWGEVYIKPFTGRVLTRAAFSFGTCVDKFRRAAEHLGGIALPHGDAAYEFTLWDGYRMRLIVWEGDDEFPPNAQVLYTANFADGFAAEDRVVAGDLLITALKAAM